MQIITATRGGGKVFAEEMSNTEDTVADGSDHDDALERAETLQLRIQEHKQEKRNAKSLMTRLLNKLAGSISDESSQKNEVNLLMERIEEQKDETLRIMEQLEGAYRESKDADNVSKVSDEADALVEQVDRETSSARSFLASLAQVQSRPSSIADSQASEQRRAKEQAERDARRQKERIEAEIKKKREELESQEKQLKSAEEEVKKRRQELEAEIEAELGIGEKDYEENFASRGSAGSQETEEITAKAAQPQARRPANGKAHGDESMKQLERIRIPVFAGNKMNFQRWHAAFTCCVDQTPLTPQFKMLRLEACLVGEAAETIKGLGYSLEAYEAAKARLVRKYGGSR